jgi:hypothetical protein
MIGNTRCWGSNKYCKYKRMPKTPLSSPCTTGFRAPRPKIGPCCKFSVMIGERVLVRISVAANRPEASASIKEKLRAEIL